MFTKGDWKAVKSPMGDWVIEMEGILICREVRHYNVPIIIQAPKLYEALKEVNLVWQGLDPNTRFPHLHEVIEQAIAPVEKK